MDDQECILYPDQYNFLWKTSFCSLASSLCAIYNGYYDLGVVNGCVFLSSIYYWRKPDYSWRRYLDMGLVKTALTYSVIRAYNAEYAKTYYTMLFMGVGFYPISIMYYRNKMYWKSTYAHSMLHVVANSAKIILYTGAIVPIRMNPFFLHFTTF